MYNIRHWRDPKRLTPITHYNHTQSLTQKRDGD